MQKIFDSIITGFFVLVFGMLWLFTTKQYTQTKNFEIIIANINNEKIKQEKLRTVFRTQEVAYSYLKEYETQYPEYVFTLKFPEMAFKQRWIRVFKN
ncbi:MAG: hypothetical protein R3327_05565 [Nitrosopumilaceae archaeon]|nr:hypothetical protein [Nitrosopumilaceae archaeon]